MNDSAPRQHRGCSGKRAPSPRQRPPRQRRWTPESSAISRTAPRRWSSRRRTSSSDDERAARCARESGNPKSGTIEDENCAAIQQAAREADEPFEDLDPNRVPGSLYKTVEEARTEALKEFVTPPERLASVESHRAAMVAFFRKYCPRPARARDRTMTEP